MINLLCKLSNEERFSELCVVPICVREWSVGVLCIKYMCIIHFRPYSSPTIYIYTVVQQSDFFCITGKCLLLLCRANFFMKACRHLEMSALLHLLPLNIRNLKAR